MVVLPIEILVYVVCDKHGFWWTIFFNRDIGVQERQESVFRFFHCEFDVGILAVDMAGEFLHVIGV